MSPPRSIALKLVTGLFGLVGAAGLVGLVSACGGSAQPGETSVTPSAVPVSIARTGGVAGLNQSIEIAADGAWVYTDKRRNQSESGTLGADQQTELFRLVSDPTFSDQLSKGDKPDCADAFHYTISTGGESRSFDDCGSATDAPTVKSAIAVITEATPF